MVVTQQCRTWRQAGRLAIVAATALVALLLLASGVSPFVVVTPTEAAGVPYLERLELITDQATRGTGGDGDGWGNHKLRVERTSTGDIFANYLAAGNSSTDHQWVLMHRPPSGGWSQVTQGSAGREPVHTLLAPNDVLQIIAWPGGFPSLSTAAGSNGATPFSSASVSGPFSQSNWPYAGAATNGRGDTFVLQSGTDHNGSYVPGSLQGSYRLASNGQWRGMTLNTDVRYDYTILLPDDSGGLDIVGTSGITWSDAGYRQPSNTGFGYVYDRIRYWHTDNVANGSFQNLLVMSEPQPSGSNAFVSIFAQDAYRDTQGRTHIMYAVQGPNTGQQVVAHHAIVQNGSVVKDITLAVDCPDTARLIQDASGRFYVISACSSSIMVYPADSDDGTQLGAPTRLDVGAYPLSSWFWLAVPRGGTARADYIDGVYAAGQDSQLVYFRARLNYSASGSATSQYASTVLADQPGGYWRLGEASGPFAIDSSGNGNTGTYGGGVSFGASPAVGGDNDTAVTLDGSSGHVSVPDGSALELAAPFSVEAWVKPNGVSHDQRVVAKGSGYGDWNLTVDSAGRPSLGLTSGGSSYQWATGSAGLPQGSWSHVVGVYDGYRLVLYVNGSAVASTSATTWARLTNWGYTIGQDQSGGDQFNGSIDDVAVYGVALSPDRVAAHFNAASSTSSSGPPSNPPPSSPPPSGGGSAGGYNATIVQAGPNGYWRLDEGGGSQAADGSGHGHTGSYSASGVTRGVAGALAGDADAAAAFDGSRGRVTINGVGNFSGTGGFTAEAWVYPTSFPSSVWGRILSQESSSTNQPGWSLFVNASTGALAGKRADGNGTDWVGGSTALPINQWSYVVLTYDGSTLRLYRNGHEIQKAPSSRNLPSSSAAMVIGASASGQPFTGRVDEPAVYDWPLSTVEIQSHYQAGTNGG